jgi:hypothetical protein
MPPKIPFFTGLKANHTPPPKATETHSVPTSGSLEGVEHSNQHGKVDLEKKVCAW